MSYFKSPYEILLENNSKKYSNIYLKKIQLLTDDYIQEDPISIAGNPYKYLCDKYLYKVITPYNLSEYNPNLPSINFLKNSYVSKLEKDGFDFKNLLNKPADKNISISKVLFYKKFKDKSYVPKTVFTKNDVKSLKFPIVGKPDKGHSGKGIFKFTTKTQFQKSKEKFDLYQEAIEIKEEFRIVYNNKTKEPIIYMKRIPHKTGKKGSIKDSIYFSYEYQLIEDFYINFPYKEKTMDIIEDMSNDIGLEIITFDFILSKDSNIFVTEINSEPGTIGYTFIDLYKSIYSSHYGSIPKSLEDVLEKLKWEFYKVVISNKRCEISKNLIRKMIDLKK